jgi:hypothetical protein
MPGVRPTLEPTPPSSPRRRGRPHASTPRGSNVTAWVTTAEHDQLILRAKQQDQSVSATLRDLIVATLRTTTG